MAQHLWNNIFCLKHPVAWWHWKNVNLTLVAEKNYREKGKQKFVGYEVIIEHFGSVNPYKKDYLEQKNFMEDLLFFVGKGYMFIFVVENQWLRHMVLHQNS